ncbi:1-deoxy-D-xylulose-5-phosphate reductoisomerase [Mycoplasmatota bacterium]|nr:1-deoxy-D-xylulose-5-phosphate reductoisomerase [Mycoplasmatota bacterium]
MKNIILLGATGSIGTQTLDVIAHNEEDYQLISIALGKNIKKAIEIIKKFRPLYVSVENECDANYLKNLFKEIEFGYGEEGLIKAATIDSNNSYETVVVTAVVGSVGLLPTIEAIKKGFTIALANKETLVTAGHIVCDLANKHQVNLLPVDSEHSAIFQSLNGENPKNIKQLIITASGGSFRDKSREDLKKVTLKEALNHPNWSMGSKITIDSATMMNKGFEVIEAHYLFQLPYERITTLLHKESVIHSMVEFVDTSIIAQLGTPDMRIPIQYALSYPERIELKQAKRLKLEEIALLHFNTMDFNRFPCLKYAYDAGNTGGSMPTVLNAANEAAVKLFLEGKISFLEIEKIIYESLEKHKVIKEPDLETILLLDKDTKKRILSTHLKGE